MFAIPPRSPDINPIENFFHLLQIELTKQALERKIRHETFTEFSSRVKDTMSNFSASTIDKVINSMDKRISLIIKGKKEKTEIFRISFFYKELYRGGQISVACRTGAVHLDFVHCFFLLFTRKFCSLFSR